MSRSLRQRIERLEGDRGNQDVFRHGIRTPVFGVIGIRPTPIDNQEMPNVVVATCPIPEADLPLRVGTIERWLAAGLAHIAFKGHAVLYNGGRRQQFTVDEWLAQCCVA